MVDQSTVDKTTERWLGEIEYQVNYKLWCWGHYHANRVYPNTDRQDRLMLSNNCVLDLEKYFNGNNNLYDSLIKIGNDVNIDSFS
jgi:3-oxoacid CoA-transferase subunit A